MSHPKGGLGGDSLAFTDGPPDFPSRWCLPVLIWKVGLGHFTSWAKQTKTQEGKALGPLSSGFKNHGTHNTPLFPDWNSILFPVGENIVVLNVECGELYALRQCFCGLKVCGKCTLPNIYIRCICSNGTFNVPIDALPLQIGVGVSTTIYFTFSQSFLAPAIFSFL